VRDTRFGNWLIGTDLWRRYVIQASLRELGRLLGGQSAVYASILDFGCGTGKALPLLDRIFRPDRLIGVDPDRAMLVRAFLEGARCRCPVDLRP